MLSHVNIHSGLQKEPIKIIGGNMIHDCSKKIINVIKLGKLPVDEVNQVLFLANQIQKKFHFEYLSQELPLEEKYKLQNGGYDLCKATKNLVFKAKYKKLPRPLIVLSSEALGSSENSSDPDWFYFSSKEEDYDADITVMSIQPLKYLAKNRRLQDYLLMMLATFIFTQYADYSFHDDTRGCIFDYCDELSEMERCFVIGSLCDECLSRLQKIERQGKMSSEEIAATYRLLNRSLSRKYCFIAMPFGPEFDKIKEIITSTLTGIGWFVKRADDIVFPRLITSKILREILTSDVVIADLTTFNPNVFYEVGLTHSLGNDLLLITQEKSTPIDLKDEQTIFYSKDDLSGLKTELLKTIGNSNT